MVHSDLIKGLEMDTTRQSQTALGMLKWISSGTKNNLRILFVFLLYRSIWTIARETHFGETLRTQIAHMLKKEQIQK